MAVLYLHSNGQLSKKKKKLHGNLYAISGVHMYSYCVFSLIAISYFNSFFVSQVHCVVLSTCAMNSVEFTD